MQVYLVLEFCAGADLHQHLMQSERGYFTEVQVTTTTTMTIVIVGVSTVKSVSVARVSTSEYSEQGAGYSDCEAMHSECE